MSMPQKPLPGQIPPLQSLNTEEVVGAEVAYTPEDKAKAKRLALLPSNQHEQ